MVNSGWHLRFSPRKWQDDAFKLWAENKRGIVQVVTGGGKTVFAEQCILRYLTDVPTGKCLVIVPSTSLLDQWYVALQEELNVDRSQIGLLGGGEKPHGNEIIVIAVINSARKFSAKFAAKQETLLIVDECHRAGSSENSKALEGSFSATLGLSATPDREYDEGFETLIQPKLGPIIYDYGYTEAADDGVIAPFDLINVQIDMRTEERAAYDKISKGIATAMRQPPGKRDEEKIKRLLQRRAAMVSVLRMRIPVAIRLVEQHTGERCVVFHERVDAAEELLALLSQRGHRATIYHAAIGADLRRDNLRLFRRGQFDVLVCCRALDEGMNVPEASVAIIASSTASKRQRIQRLGRILRTAPGKNKATIFTIFATAEERKRLSEEADQLVGTSSVVWQTGKLRANAENLP